MTLEYVDAQGEASMRTVSPVAMISTDGGRHALQDTYLQARCSIANALRTFRFDRIDSLSDPVTGETYELIPWAQALQLGEPRPFNLFDDVDPEPEPEAAAERAAATVTKVPLWMRVRLIIWSLLVGYLIGRMRVLWWLLEMFHQRWGLWL